MKILGIHDGHNASACLLDDGVIRYVIQEERLSAIKNHTGFPRLAIQEILKATHLSVNDIDWVAMHSYHLPRSMNREELMKHFLTFSTILGKIKRLAKVTPLNYFYRKSRRRKRERALVGAGFPLDRVVFVEHHLAHATAAYFGSPWRDKVLILTADGAGDGLCATVNKGVGNTIQRIAQVEECHSVGIIYAMITFMLGMVPNEHEYKIMGMAPYASKKEVERSYSVFKNLLEFDRANTLIWRKRRGIPNVYYSLGILQKLLAFHRFDGICGGLQKWTEDMLRQWIQNCLGKLGIKKIVLGGGVFMNVKANKVISEIPAIEKIFVFPSCGDESNSIGAAFWLYSQKKESNARDIQPIQDIYWGNEYSDDEIKKVLETQSPLSYSYIKDIEKEIARLLSEGEIVARFKGRMEFGARALGNRSILANPSHRSVIKTINDMIKGRDFWMPFALSILKERERDYLKSPRPIDSPYMMMCFDTTGKREEIEAGIHPYDFTVRPQIVSQGCNPEYHRLIKEFEKIRGIGAILNTSFNLHGYPIVGTPEQALKVFKSSGLKFLALGNWLVKKK